jgi:hypothetical protein
MRDGAPICWKCAWVQKGFGWPLAKRAELLMPRCKWSMIRSWDKALSRFDELMRNLNSHANSRSHWGSSTPR